MVFFTCNNCGDSVKKPSVEKHYATKCRANAVNVSCMDCLQDFGDDFVGHTKCITEAQKYSGKNYVAKESKNSGAKKQESWMDIVRSILETNEYQLRPEVRNAFQRLQSMDNVPRKKAKFENFTVNCLRLPKPTAAKVWTVLEQELEKMKQAFQQSKEANKREPEQNGNDEPAKKKVKQDEQPATNGHNKSNKKKSKQEDKPETTNETAETNGNGEHVAATQNEDDVFDWSTVIEKLVAKHSDGISLEKLKRKTQKKYAKKLESDELSEKQQKKFEKKFTKHLKKCPQVQVENDVARPC